MKLTYEGLKKLITELLTEKREDRIRELGEYVDKGYFVHLFELPKVEKDGSKIQISQFSTSDNVNRYKKATEPGHKFGINPKSNYNTPLGIYGYPLTKQIYDQIINGTLPFALERLYLHIFKPKEGTNIIDLQNFTEEDLNYYIEKLKETSYINSFINKFGQENLDKILKQKNYAAKVKTPGGIFWYITWKLQNGTLDWNKLFRKLGIDGFIDNGQGIIHDAEKTQAVFFTKLVVDHIDTIENPSKKSDRYKFKHKTFNVREYYNAMEVSDKILNQLPKILTKEDWGYISVNWKMYPDFMKKFENYINWNDFNRSNDHITEEIIEAFPEKIDWKRLSRITNNLISEEFIEKYFDKFDKKLILGNYIFSEDFLERHFEVLDKKFISRYQDLSVNFIKKYFNYLYFDELMKNENLGYAATEYINDVYEKNNVNF